EVVPGVLPELAAGAHAGVPLTHQGLSAAVTLVDYDAASDPSAGVAWDSIARSGGTIVVRVRRSRLPTAAATLLSAGAPAELPAVVVGRGALAGEPTLT